MEKKEKKKLLAWLKYEAELVEKDLTGHGSGVMGQESEGKKMDDTFSIRSAFSGLMSSHPTTNHSSSTVNRQSVLCPRRLHF